MLGTKSSKAAEEYQTKLPVSATSTAGSRYETRDLSFLGTFSPFVVFLEAAITNHCEAPNLKSAFHEGRPISNFESALLHPFLRADDLKHPLGMEGYVIGSNRGDCQNWSSAYCMLDSRLLHHIYALATEKES